MSYFYIFKIVNQDKIGKLLDIQYAKEVSRDLIFANKEYNKKLGFPFLEFYKYDNNNQRKQNKIFPIDRGPPSRVHQQE